MVPMRPGTQRAVQFVVRLRTQFGNVLSDEIESWHGFKPIYTDDLK